MNNDSLDLDYVEVKAEFFENVFLRNFWDSFTFEEMKNKLTKRNLKVNDEKLKNLIAICEKKGWLTNNVLYEPTFLLMKTNRNELNALIGNGKNDAEALKIIRELKKLENKEQITKELVASLSWSSKGFEYKTKEILKEFVKNGLLVERNAYIPQEKFLTDNKQLVKYRYKFAPADEFLVEDRTR